MVMTQFKNQKRRKNQNPLSKPVSRKNLDQAISLDAEMKKTQGNSRGMT